MDKADNSTTFSELYSKYRLLIATFIVGLAIGILATSAIFIKSRPTPPSTKPSATVENKSGAPLKVKDVKSNKNDITIRTQYDGQGESDIKLPTASVPSAWAWENYHWSACGGYMSNKTILAGVGYRYNRITVSGGPFVKVGSNVEIGLWAMGSYSFQRWW